jgi:hypothetical protein
MSRIFENLARTMPAVVVLVVGLAGAGCTGNGTGEKCDSDLQCAEFFTCDVPSGTCLCTGDAACNADGQRGFCNAAGICQPQSGCLTNADCNTDGDGCEAEYCNTKTNQCLSVCHCDPASGDVCCSTDSQCGFGKICNELEGRCIDGCRDDGDCRLGEGCIREGIAAIGTCAEGVCTANNQCDFQEVCDLEAGQCVLDTRGPFCSGCAGGLGSDDCGEPANYCLTDSSDPTGQTSFCGVDCAQQQACPFGYECAEVIIIPQTLPFCSPPEVCEKQAGQQTGNCSFSSNVTCQEDEDCPFGPPGSDCPKWQTMCDPGDTCPGGSECPPGGICPAFGHCLVDQSPCELDTDCCEDPTECPEDSCVLQRCVGSEGSAFGYCTCTIDSDCPRDFCQGQDLSDPDNPVFGNCELSGHKCLDDIDCDVIACVDGGCRIGANCAPSNDRNCSEVNSRGE